MSSSRRLTHGAVIALLVIAQLGAFAHHAAARHAQCVEHGELVEAPELAKHTHEGTQLVGVELGIDSDEHCVIDAALRSHASPAVAPAVAPLPPILCVPRVDRADVARLVTALFRIAPKTSPPASPQSFT